MANSPNLALPFLESAQAQKHVTHNAALAMLDAVIMLSVLDRDLTAPPGSPAEGDRYLVASPASDGWVGRDGTIAAWQDGAWAFYQARQGWHVWIADEGIALSFDGAGWIGIATQNAALLGVNTSADPVNRLAVSAAAALFTHAGGDMQLKLNKNENGDTACILFQTGFAGRAEIGCIGNDDFAFKTSADGSEFHAGLTLVPAAKGVPRLPSFAMEDLPSAATAGAGACIYISDEVDGGVLAFSDGMDWRRATDRAVVS